MQIRTEEWTAVITEAKVYRQCSKFSVIHCTGPFTLKKGKMVQRKKAKNMATQGLA
jgi:hypothetical protein